MAFEALELKMWIDECNGECVNMNQKKEYWWGYDELVVGVPSIFYVIGFLKPKGQNWKIQENNLSNQLGK